MVAYIHTALRKQRQEDPCEFEASLVYIVSSRTARAMQRDFVSKESEREREIETDRQKKRKEKIIFPLPDLITMPL